MSCGFKPEALNRSNASGMLVPGPGKLTSSAFDLRPSSLPVGTLYLGPPDKATARVIMSAHDTVDGHSFSNAFFTSSMNSYPLTVWFGPASFSDWSSSVESIRIDA